MRDRHQLNVNITSELLSSIKKTARKRGMTIGEFITDLALKEIGESEREDSVFKSLNERITILESELSNIKFNKNISCTSKEEQDIVFLPFTQKETDNCTHFMRAVFKKVKDLRNIKTQN